MLSCLFVLPILAQPTSLRGFRGNNQLIQNRIEEAAKITSRIEKDKSNVTLYKKRLFLYGELLVLNDDPTIQNTYADRYEADFSNIIELEKTEQNYYQRGGYITTKLNNLSVKNISDLYPRNSYVDLAAADFLKALELTSDPQKRQSYYTNLSIIYSTRPQRLVAAPDFPNWHNEIPLELVKKDFEMSIKFSQLALKAGARLPFIETLKQNLVAAYLVNAETATKLGDSATALKFTQAVQKYRK